MYYIWHGNSASKCICGETKKLFSLCFDEQTVCGSSLHLFLYTCNSINNAFVSQSYCIRAVNGFHLVKPWLFMFVYLFLCPTQSLIFTVRWVFHNKGEESLHTMYFCWSMKHRNFWKIQTHWQRRTKILGQSGNPGKRSVTTASVSKKGDNDGIVGETLWLEQINYG